MQHSWGVYRAGYGGSPFLPQKIYGMIPGGGRDKADSLLLEMSKRLSFPPPSSLFENISVYAPGLAGYTYDKYPGYTNVSWVYRTVNILQGAYNQYSGIIYILNVFI